jgi:hypothetical protein
MRISDGEACSLKLCNEINYVKAFNSSEIK